MIVWLLTGFWHGAAWNFVAWGLFYGVLLIFEKLFLLKWLKLLPAVFRHIYAMLAVMAGWVLFAFDDFGKGFAYLGRMFGVGAAGVANSESLYLLTGNLVLFVILIIGSTPIPARLAAKFMGNGEKKSAFACAVAFIFLAIVFALSFAYITASTYNPFLYFRF